VYPPLLVVEHRGNGQAVHADKRSFALAAAVPPAILRQKNGKRTCRRAQHKAPEFGPLRPRTKATIASKPRDYRFDPKTMSRRVLDSYLSRGESPWGGIAQRQGRPRDDKHPHDQGHRRQVAFGRSLLPLGAGRKAKLACAQISNVPRRGTNSRVQQGRSEFESASCTSRIVTTGQVEKGSPYRNGRLRTWADRGKKKRNLRYAGHRSTPTAQAARHWARGPPSRT